MLKRLALLVVGLWLIGPASADEQYPVGFKVRLTENLKMTVRNPDPVHDGPGLQDRRTYKTLDHCEALIDGTLTVIGKAPSPLSLVVYYNKPPNGGYNGCPRGTIDFTAPEPLGRLVEAARAQDASKAAVKQEQDRLRKLIQDHERREPSYR